MSLPSSRNTTYAATSPVKSADLNLIQDCIIGGKHGTLTKQVGISPSCPGYANASGIATSGGALSSGMIIPLHVGDRIATVRAYVNDNATGPTKVRLQFGKINAGAFVQLATVLSSGLGGDQTLTLSALAKTLLTGEMCAIIVDNFGGGAGSCKAYFCEVDYDRP